MNKLQRELIDTINNKSDKFIKRFELFNNNEEYWNEDIAEDITRNLAYSRNCNEWLDVIMYFNYDILLFPTKFLLPEFDDIFIDELLSLEHANILHKYFISRFIVSLICKEKVNKDYLKKSLKYYQLYMEKDGFKNETDIFNDKGMSMSYILGDVVPSGLVRHLLGISFDEISSKISPNVRTFDMIWSYAWRLLYRLNTGKLDNIDKHWKNLIISWKKCFIKDEYHAFSPSLVVLLYFSYCQAKDIPFKIEDLIAQIVN